MVNHPNRSGQTPVAMIRRMLTAHSLQRIEITATLHGFSARAMPDGFHPMVSKRREAAFAGLESVTMKEASVIHEAALEAIAAARGDTLDDALQALRERLRRAA